jgi:hypothetical protein
MQANATTHIHILYFGPVPFPRAKNAMNKKTKSKMNDAIPTDAD